MAPDELLDETAVALLTALLAEVELLRDYMQWRQAAGLLPTGADCLRLRRWNRQAACWGVLLPLEWLP